MPWDPDLLTVKDVCDALDIKRETLWRWRAKGIAPRGFKVGQKIVFKRADVDRWLEERRAS